LGARDAGDFAHEVAMTALTGSTTPASSAPLRRRRAGLLAGLLLSLLIVVCLAGGTGAYLLVQHAQPVGSTQPQAAVDGFLGAVFTDHDPDKAGEFVCARARDPRDLQRLVEKVSEVEERYRSPRTTWQIGPTRRGDHEASVPVRLTLTTGDDQVAEHEITLLLVDQRGWWVCDVEAAG
jgi:hypothetical protein